MSKAPAVDYALEIIEFFASRTSEIGIADISNSLGINKNAISRVLDALLEKNWIYLSDSSQKKYKLTLRPFSLITEHINQNSMVSIAEPYIRQLNKELGDAVYLGVKNERNVLYLIHHDSSKEVRINGRAGGKYPLNCSAPGKVLLSFSDEKEIKDYFDTVPEKRTKNTITDLNQFLSEAETIKKAGYAVDNEEFAKGIICIAVPVFDYAENVAASIGISTLTLYDDIDSLINEKFALLKNAAAKLSADLGYIERGC